MRATLTLAVFFAVKSFSIGSAAPVTERGPFLDQINSTHWMFGNDLWNVTQGPSYAINLQYQGSDVVNSAVGDHAEYGMHHKLSLSFFVQLYKHPRHDIIKLLPMNLNRRRIEPPSYVRTYHYEHIITHRHYILLYVRRLALGNISRS